MKLIETGFRGLAALEPKVFGDARGYFMESYNARVLTDLGLEANFVQDNQSFSTQGVVRGLHYQNAPYAQTKLVRVLQGKILDVVVDLRRAEPTFGKWFSVELSSENKKQLYVPKGFAHGFAVLSDTAEILYKCDAYYNKESEGGLYFNDPALKIDWQISPDAAVLSDKDRVNPMLINAVHNF
ncbi:dTDP-4-dehydrorhamnose 3,5-epimerase [Chryseolinea sp. T2]|uniref:dTDP-4-dehydrorhamnose 3,5-epimerase n=1 Tax=Chryseolinea sp. T2 TaxID=3129255 RepID=UPI0030789F81